MWFIPLECDELVCMQVEHPLHTQGSYRTTGTKFKDNYRISRLLKSHFKDVATNQPDS